MGSVTRGEQAALGGTDGTEAFDGDVNERPTSPGVRLPEPWPERSTSIPLSLRTRTSRWRAVAAAAVEGGAARVSLVDPDEHATPVSTDSGARQVVPEPSPQPIPSPAIPEGRPRSRATVRMFVPGLRGPTGTRKMWARSSPNASPDPLSLGPPLAVSRRWSLVAIVVGTLCVASVVVAVRIGRHRERLAAPAQTTAHVP